MLKVSNALLEHMRDQAESLMTDTCTIEVQSASYGEMGELIEGYTLVASDVSCRVIDAASQNVAEVVQQGDRETIFSEVRIVVPYDTALAVDQRITTSDGTAWQVGRLVTARTNPIDAQAVVVRVYG